MSSTGRAPEFSWVARSFASCSVKLPVITPNPPVIADCTTGLEMISRSTTIAIWLRGGGCVTAAVVASANRSPPELVRSNWTLHSVILDDFVAVSSLLRHIFAQGYALTAPRAAHVETAEGVAALREVLTALVIGDVTPIVFAIRNHLENCRELFAGSCWVRQPEVGGEVETVVGGEAEVVGNSELVESSHKS